MIAGHKDPSISPRQLKREALRALPHLSKDGAYLARAPGRAARRAGIMGVYLTPGQAKPTLELEAAIVRRFVACDWLEPADPERFLITGAGRAWIRRAGARSEPFGAQHQERRRVRRSLPDGRVDKIVVNDAESPLSWLARRRGTDGLPLLTNEQFQAGERLRSDFTKGQLVPATTVNWSGFDAPGSGRYAGAREEISDLALAARARTQRALESLSPEMGGLLIDVCCLLIGLEDAERSRNWPRRSAKLVLRLALSELARHYGILNRPPTAQGRRPVQSRPARRPAWFSPGRTP